MQVLIPPTFFKRKHTNESTINTINYYWTGAEKRGACSVRHILVHETLHRVTLTCQFIVSFRETMGSTASPKMLHRQTQTPIQQSKSDLSASINFWLDIGECTFSLLINMNFCFGSSSIIMIKTKIRVLQ